MILQIGNRKNKSLSSKVSCRCAFTLMELLLVTVILVVAAAVVVPNFAHRSRQMELSSAAQRMAYTIRFAQVRAMTKGKSLRLVMNSSAYWLEEDNSAQSDEIAQLVKKHDYREVKARWGRRMNIPGNIRLMDAGDPVDITPDGKISAANVRLCRGDECLLISTTEQLGRVSVLIPEKNEDHAV